MAHYGTSAGRFPAPDFIRALPLQDRARILADLDTFAEQGERSATSWRWIKGHTPMRELRVGSYRILFVIESGTMIVLEACKKQNQEAAIERAAARMKEI